MNWKLRLKNKATLTALVAAAITFVYSVLGTLGIAPAVGQEQVTSLVSALLTVLAALGIVTDPTTPGVSDSERAKGYTEPGGGDDED